MALIGFIIMVSLVQKPLAKHVLPFVSLVILWQIQFLPVL